LRRIVPRILLLLGSTAFFFGLAEVLYRWLAKEEITAANLHARYRVFYQDANRKEVGPTEAAAAGLIAPIPAEQSPRPRLSWAPGKTFWLCYSGVHQDWFDEQGCVPCTMNSRGIREREELCEPKPPGQRRILCLGDSFTFGWGVRVEDAWPRRCEAILRQRDDGIRTVNCGAAGAIYVDEYQWGLEHRFFVFEPDAVLVTLCLNDLLPTSTALAHSEPLPWFMKSRILRDLFQSYALEASLRIDPARDLVQGLLDLPEPFYPLWAAVDPHKVGRAALWPGGGPQQAMRAMRDWCKARSIPFAVAIWPYLQGLGPRDHYPFAKIHELVGGFCKAEGIPFLDLLPALRGHDSGSLWVSPADYHPNVEAQQLVEQPIARFLTGLLGL
jgi:lysophospholipase L1-like esterase